jgi:tetratricopeptide (TPR) repeat protein
MRESEVLGILGPHADAEVNLQLAAQMALEETATLGGRDLYFAWFNLGSNRVALQDYAAAAEAYDQAFTLYAALPEGERPWRMLWYQTGPYEAYYYTSRYQDVINLANTTLSFLNQPILEETLYWRGLAKEALGDQQGAILDLQRAVSINPMSTGAQAHLERLEASVQ